MKMASILNNSAVNNSVRILISDADYAAVELFKGYPDGLLKFASVCCVICMMIGIPGNIVTIVALAKYKRVRNATAIFIMNLSCSDLLFCCLTPSLSASTYWQRSWTHGGILCRLYPPARYILIATSIFTILAITINRYIIVVYPRLYRKIYQKRNLFIMVAVIWIAPLVALIPTMFKKWGRFDLDEKNGSCTIVRDENNRSSKQFLFISAFVLPCIPMLICYARIFFIVREATKKSQNSPNTSTDNSTTGNSTSITVRVTNLDSETTEDKGTEIPMNTFSKLKSEHSTASTVQTTDGAQYNTDTDEDEEMAELPEQPQTRGNPFKRSKALLKISLPTRKDKRLGTMILAIMTSFCLCHLPIVLTKVILWTAPHPAVNIAAHILLYLSSCINPVIYVVMSKEYKKAYMNLFKCHNRGRLLIKNNK